jgi:hypothetical protein
MPTVLRIDGFRIVVYPNDHRPPHVHVIGGGGEALFILHCPGGPPTLSRNFGFPLAQLNAIVRELDSRIEELCHAWYEIHGNH